jgi:hypothetical protein
VNVYVYRWSIRPEVDLTLDLRMTAPSVAEAQRKLRRFLFDHDGNAWEIESVSREATSAPRETFSIASERQC